MNFSDTFSYPTFHLGGKTIDPLGAFGRERDKHLEPLRRELHNQNPPIDEIRFSEQPCKNHKNPLVASILKNLSRLNGYTLHVGEAFSTEYHGPNLKYKKMVSSEVFKIRNNPYGLGLEFRIVEGFRNRSAVHVLMVTRDTEKQGSFHAFKRMLVVEIWKQILEPAGFVFLYGRAIWSVNSEIRNSCPKSKDWRDVPCYAGLNSELQPILVPGLRLLYYRMGFTQLGMIVDGFGPDYVALLANDLEREFIKKTGEKHWKHLTQFSLENSKQWRETVSDRESMLPAGELEKRIQEAKKKASLKTF